MARDWADGCSVPGRMPDKRFSTSKLDPTNQHVQPLVSMIYTCSHAISACAQAKSRNTFSCTTYPDPTPSPPSSLHLPPHFTSLFTSPSSSLHLPPHLTSLLTSPPPHLTSPSLHLPPHFTSLLTSPPSSLDLPPHLTSLLTSPPPHHTSPAPHLPPLPTGIHVHVYCGHVVSMC